MSAFAVAPPKMAPFDAPDGVEARVAGETLVVTIAADADVDRAAARRINRGFIHALAESELAACLTVLEAEDAFSSGVFSEVKRAAAASVAQNVARWAVVVDDRDAGEAFAAHLDGLETRLFEDEDAALAWTNDA